jgi:hypothetical protein
MKPFHIRAAKKEKIEFCSIFQVIDDMPVEAET